MIKELIDELVEGEKDFVSSLRKAKLIASELKIVEMKNWLKGELEGYRMETSIPDYRKLFVQSLGTFSGPFGSGTKNIVLPTMGLPEVLRKFAEMYEVHESISELKELVNNQEGKLTRKWPAEVIIGAREYIQMSGGQVLVDAEQMISRSMLAGIIENSKNKLLDFLLELKEEKIETSNNVTAKDSVKARNMFNVNIYGSNNIVASGENITQKDIEVKQNDIDSLTKYLKQFGISPKDIVDLDKAIDEDKAKTNKKFGEKISVWLGKMLSKISEGVVTASIQAGPALIVDGIKKYIGIQ